MQSTQFNKETFTKALEEVTKIKQKYPNFGGVFNWEYFSSPPDPNIPSEWAVEMNNVIHNSSDMSKCSDRSDRSYRCAIQ